MKNLHSKYIIFGKEVGEKGTPHLQGYLVLHREKTLSATKAFIGINSIHLEIARGNSLHNEIYCGKEGEVFTKGDRPLTAKEKGEEGRQYWLQQIKDAEEGNFELIKQRDPKFYMMHLKTIQFHRTNAAIKPKALRGDGGHNWWIYGETGTGKTLGAELMYPVHYKKDPTNRWWDGYKDEEVVILDDLDITDAQKYMGKYLKTWCHNKPFTAECKGGNTRIIRPKTFIITCNWKPEDIWSDRNMLEPISRRFTLLHVDRSQLQEHILMQKTLEYKEDYETVLEELRKRVVPPQ